MIINLTNFSILFFSFFFWSTLTFLLLLRQTLFGLPPQTWSVFVTVGRIAVGRRCSLALCVSGTRMCLCVRASSVCHCSASPPVSSTSWAPKLTTKIKLATPSFSVQVLRRSGSSSIIAYVHMCVEKASWTPFLLVSLNQFLQAQTFLRCSCV